MSSNTTVLDRTVFGSKLTVRGLLFLLAIVFLGITGLMGWHWKEVAKTPFWWTFWSVWGVLALVAAILMVREYLNRRKQW